MLEWIRFILSAVLVLAGLLFVISSVVGVWRFQYVLNRMHAAALGDTLGMLLIVLGVAVRSGFQMTTLKLLLLAVIWWLSSPVASHLIGRLEITTDPALEKNMTINTESDPHEEVSA
ncbi:MAG: monovalent cation/H(+) antiporter subunit G [Clostridia bacterium]|nr:monovalent cation/H(+) antiporter subunit G [Clostridia bacterium]